MMSNELLILIAAVAFKVAVYVWIWRVELPAMRREIR